MTSGFQLDTEEEFRVGSIYFITSATATSFTRPLSFHFAIIEDEPCIRSSTRKATSMPWVHLCDRGTAAEHIKHAATPFLTEKPRLDSVSMT